MIIKVAEDKCLGDSMFDDQIFINKNLKADSMKVKQYLYLWWLIFLGKYD